MKLGEDITFENFLHLLDMSEADYIVAAWSSIKETTVFFRKSPREIRVNVYNKHLLLATEANMVI